MKFIHSAGKIHIRRIEKRGSWAKVYLDHSLDLTYVYLNKILPPQTFGVGTRHSVILQYEDKKWRVQNEWYLDPLDENPKLIPSTYTGIAPAVSSAQTQLSGSRKYNRTRALDYSNKFSGMVWEEGGGRRYNSKYKDYTGSGGDCTNFVSQVLGDREGGGLRMSREWNYRAGAGGSSAWIHTDRFKNYLLRSGKGKIVAKGYFPDVVRDLEKKSNSPGLWPGDLIAYVMKGNVDHFSVVVGFDAHGYPLVNSHTADRYRVPFDLGWDNNTEYLAIHIED